MRQFHFADVQTMGTMLSFAFSIKREATTNYRMWKQGLFPSRFFLLQSLIRYKRSLHH